MTTRRLFLQALAGVALSAPAAGLVQASASARIAHLIEKSKAHSKVSRRIDFISHALLGVRYQANTLIGGPRRQELFIVRDDAFDCVTYCEVVLAAAITQDLAGFEVLLRRIRYERGDVKWAERNHDFAKWSERVVENKICRPVNMSPSVSIEKILNGDELGTRRYSIAATPVPTLLTNQDRLQSGDLIGFVSRQPNLDFFHTGFLAFGKNGSLLLRHASQSRGRVVDEDMKEFLAANGTRYVTLLRAEQPAPVGT